MWVHSRQFTGRIVTVTNDKIFDEPVYNYTRDSPTSGRRSALPVRIPGRPRRGRGIYSTRCG